MNRILVGMSDLFFSVKINDAARRLGTSIAVVQNEAKFKELLQNQPPPLVILDLNCTTLDPIQLILQIKANLETASIPVVGFVSHVQTETRRRAAEAGCDVVVPRSVFAQDVQDILGRFIAAPAAG